ncbi:MAG: cytochrome c3 family protein [Phycisphaerales bacterium]
MTPRFAHPALGFIAPSLLMCLCVTLVACGRKPQPADPTRGVAPAASTESIPLANPGVTRLSESGPGPVLPDPKPTGPLPADASCISPACHASFATAARIHGPVALKDCSACHQDDQGGHTYPLKREKDATCTYCHTVTNTAAHQHKAVADNGCTACHNPHASRTKFLLTADNTEQLCAKCHNIPWRKHAHEPFKAGQCTLCHQPHESNHKNLLRGGDEPKVCFGCHTDKQLAIADSPFVHTPAKEQCTTCHDPHTSDNPYELRRSIDATCLSCHKDIAKTVESATVSHDAMVIADGCANCHDAHASPQPHLLKQRADKLCLTCHDKPLPAHDGHTIADMRPTLNQKFLHGPVRSGDCTACHNVHGAGHERLLVQTFPKTFYAKFDLQNYALCFTCHNKDLVLDEKTVNLTGFRDGDENLHYVHVHRAEKGRTCKTCHDIHGSDLPNHIATSVPFEGGQWAMPIKFRKTAGGGSCSPGCHEPKTYKRDLPPVPKAGEP